MNNLDPIAVFRTEAAEQLEVIEAGLLDLTRNLDDKAQIDAVFRGLHTLKGSGSMFGFDQLAAFTHHCETAFDRVRAGDFVVIVNLTKLFSGTDVHALGSVATNSLEHA